MDRVTAKCGDSDFWRLSADEACRRLGAGLARLVLLLPGRGTEGGLRLRESLRGALRVASCELGLGDPGTEPGQRVLESIRGLYVSAVSVPRDTSCSHCDGMATKSCENMHA